MKRNHKRYLRSGDLRFAVCCVVLTLLFLPLRRACAQDALPGCPRLQETAFDCDTLMVCGQRTDTLPVPLIALPAAFRQLGGNELIDSVGILKPFWEKLRMLRLGIATDTIRIVHVGDSHILRPYLSRNHGRAASANIRRTVLYGRGNKRCLLRNLYPSGACGGYRRAASRPRHSLLWNEREPQPAIQLHVALPADGRTGAHASRQAARHPDADDYPARFVREFPSATSQALLTRLIPAPLLPCEPPPLCRCQRTGRVGYVRGFRRCPQGLPQLAGSGTDASRPCALSPGRVCIAGRNVLSRLAESV